MRCWKAREVIVLRASGDATERQSRRAASHMDHCQECRRFAAAEPLSLAALRTSPALGDADFAAIRARVLSQIGESEPRRRFRFAAAAAIVLLLLGLGTLLTMRRHPAPKHHTKPTVPRVAAPLPEELPVETPRIEPGIEPARATHHRTRRASKPEMRIHIQTADPDIRIIWIVNPRHS